jgi:hypothetical protein
MCSPKCATAPGLLAIVGERGPLEAGLRRGLEFLQQQFDSLFELLVVTLPPLGHAPQPAM